MKQKLLTLFATLLITLSANAQTQYEYVDLGLPSGTLWATCNVGANSPEEFGDFFCWGETDGKKDWYEYSTYKYCMGSHLTLTKYCNNSDVSKYYPGYFTADTMTGISLTPAPSPGRGGDI
jgi:hypothetical protein